MGQGLKIEFNPELVPQSMPTPELKSYNYIQVSKEPYNIMVNAFDICEDNLKYRPLQVVVTAYTSNTIEQVLDEFEQKTGIKLMDIAIESLKNIQQELHESMADALDLKIREHNKGKNPYA